MLLEKELIAMWNPGGTYYENLDFKFSYVKQIFRMITIFVLVSTWNREARLCNWMMAMPGQSYPYLLLSRLMAQAVGSLS